MSVSQLLTSARSTSILLDTLEPPTIAQKGRLGAFTAASRKLSSCRCNQTVGVLALVTPSADVCAQSMQLLLADSWHTQNSKAACCVLHRRLLYVQ